MPALAHTYELIAAKGADVFYRGEIAEKIVADLEKNGGVLTMKDFANHTAD